MEQWKEIEGFDGNCEISSHGRFRRFRILKGSVNGGGYAVVSPYDKGKRTTMYVHVLVGIYFLGYDPKNKERLVLDHIDNDKSNNRADNLQIVTNRTNTSKDRKNKTSRFTGVSWSSQHSKWYSQIYINGKNTALGMFDCELKAKLAYDLKLKEWQNNNMNLNCNVR